MTKVIVLRCDRGFVCLLLVMVDGKYSLPTQWEFEGICDQAVDHDLQELIFSVNGLIEETVSYFTTVMSPHSCTGDNLCWVSTRDADYYLNSHEADSVKLATFQVLLGYRHVAEMETCKWCQGNGSVFNRKFRDFNNHFSRWSLPCPVCKGACTRAQPQGWVSIEDLKSDLDSKHWRLMRGPTEYVKAY